jgi:Protein of unknown function (DUF732)
MTTIQVRSLLPGRTLLASLVLGFALFGAAGVTSPAAHADAVDDAFLKAVQAKGINFSSPQAAIVAGHEVCDELDLGRQKSDVANDVMASSNLDGYRAGYFVGLSVAAYCPRYHAS